MENMKMGKIIVLLILYCSLGTTISCASAQSLVPDTTDANRYFPLEIGNVWEFSEFRFHAFYGDSLISFLRFSVIGTEVIKDNSYYVIKEEKFDNTGVLQVDSTLYSFVRFDSLSSRLLAYRSTGETGWPFGFPCSLGAGFNVSITCEQGASANTGGGYNQIISVGQQEITTNNKFYDVIPFGSDIPKLFCNYGADVGLYYFRHEKVSFMYYWKRAEYIRINGVEYGQPIPVALKPQPSVSQAVRLAQNIPNPALGATRISFTLPSPSTVRLTVFDLTGREVARLVDAPRAVGFHSVHFDTGMLPTGPYVYQLEAAGEVHARSMVVIR